MKVVFLVFLRIATGGSLALELTHLHARRSVLHVEYCSLMRRSCRVSCVESDIERLEVKADGTDNTNVMDFRSLGVTVPGVVDNLESKNISQPNALQRAAFAPLSSSRDAILHAYTGSGKTLAFLLPLLEQLQADSKEPQAVVVSPSRELAFQTYRVAEMLLKDTPLRVAAVVGGTNGLRQIEKIRQQRPQLLIGTPGRLCELAFEWQKLKLQRVRHLVVDEVDEALGPTQLDSLTQLISALRDGRPLQMILASATADTPVVRRAAFQLLEKPLLIRLVGAEDSARADVPELPTTISHTAYLLPQHKHLESIKQLINSSPKPRCLVFVESPHRVRIVCEKLLSDYQVEVAALYGQQEREEKVSVMRKFIDGKLQAVVCTEMGARGLDIPGLTHVVNLDLPTDTHHYVHRAGRTGRAGTEGMVINVVAPNKLFVVEKLTKQLGLKLKHIAIKGGQLLTSEAPAAAQRSSRPSAKPAPRSRPAKPPADSSRPPKRKLASEPPSTRRDKAPALARKPRLASRGGGSKP